VGCAVGAVAAMPGDHSMDLNEVVFKFQHIRVGPVAEDHFAAQVVFLSHCGGEILQSGACESQHRPVSSYLNGWLAGTSSFVPTTQTIRPVSKPASEMLRTASSERNFFVNYETGFYFYQNFAARGGAGS
jgi:hypothetical protein